MKNQMAESEYRKDKTDFFRWYLGFTAGATMLLVSKALVIMIEVKETVAVHTQLIQRNEMDIQEGKRKNDEQDKAIYRFPKMNAMLPRELKFEPEYD